MARVKPTEQIAEKWSRVTPQRAQDFERGVREPVRDWATAAAGAEGSFRDGVQAAAREGRFGRGVRRAGTEKWQRKTLEKGPARFSEGVAVSAPDFQAGFEPFRRTIEATELPPRFPKGDPRNIERVRVIAAALNKAKTGNRQS